MTAKYEPELGQMVIGNPTGEYECPRFVDALLNTLLDEIARVYWNIHQHQWDRTYCIPDPEIPGIQVRSYWWGDEDVPEVSMPNFAFKDAEIRWYKYPGRGQSVNVDWTAEQWRQWFDECYATIQQFEEATDGRASKK